MDNQLLTQQTLGSIVSILQIAIPIGFAFFGLYKAKVVDYIKAKIATIKDEETRKLVQDAFERVDNLLDTEISNVENTAKEQILKDIASGKVDKDSLKNLGVVVANSVTNQLNEKTIAILSQEVTDVQAYISSRLEKVLGDLKVDDSSSVSKTIVEVPTQPIIDTTELENKNVELIDTNTTLTDTNSTLQATNIQLKAENEELQSKLSTIQSALQPVASTIDNSVQTANSVTTLI